MKIFGDLDEQKKIHDLLQSKDRTSEFDRVYAKHHAQSIGEVALGGPSPRRAIERLFRTTGELDRQDEYDCRGGYGQGTRRRETVNAALWFAVIFLVLALLAVLGYTYGVLRKNHLSLSQVPGITLSVQS